MSACGFECIYSVDIDAFGEEEEKNGNKRHRQHFIECLKHVFFRYSVLFAILHGDCENATHAMTLFVVRTADALAHKCMYCMCMCVCRKIRYKPLLC